jgi:hypothetical protein
MQRLLGEKKGTQTCVFATWQDSMVGKQLQPRMPRGAVQEMNLWYFWTLTAIFRNFRCMAAGGFSSFFEPRKADFADIERRLWLL